jgi:hypothetical protein
VLGWSSSAQRHAVKVGDLERVYRGVLAPPMSVDPDLPRRRHDEQANLRQAQASASRALIYIAPRWSKRT